jgi:hypothetical protein
MRSKGADLQTPRRRDDRRAQRVDDALNVDTHGRAVQGSLRHVELELLRAHEGCVELPIWPKEAPGEELAPELALVEKPFFIYNTRWRCDNAKKKSSQHRSHLSTFHQLHFMWWF